MRTTHLFALLAGAIAIFWLAPADAAAQCGPCDSTEAGGSYYHWFEASQEAHYSCEDHGGCHPSTQSGACSSHSQKDCGAEEEEQFAMAVAKAEAGTLTKRDIDALIQDIGSHLTFDALAGVVRAHSCNGERIGEITVPVEWLQ